MNKTQVTVLVIAEHDEKLKNTLDLFQREGFRAQALGFGEQLEKALVAINPTLIACHADDASLALLRRHVQTTESFANSRLPTLILCELNEIDQGAKLCKEGLGDDYLILPHLAQDPARLTMVIERLKKESDQAQQRMEVTHTLCTVFKRYEHELLQELQRFDPNGKGQKRLAVLGNAVKRVKSKLTAAPVLVVEDNLMFQAWLKSVVAPLQQPVHVAGDAGEAMEWLKNNEPAVMLLDYDLPGQNGLRLLEQIRQTPHLRHVPVIMLTGLSRLEIVQTVSKFEAVDFVVKPSDPETLRKKLGVFV